MAFSAERCWRQARVKMRLIAAREMRKWRSGELDILPGNTVERATLDAIRQAYAAGLRDARTPV